ncbi:MAG: hypothetical protein RIS47_2206 [Bacteroidota bacterium]
MPIYLLSEDNLLFPPPWLAHDEGMLAIGGDLTPDRLIEAYRNGVFPWFGPDDPIIWWSPLERFVIFPTKVKISKSMKQILRKADYRVSFDEAFAQVLKACQQTYPRNEQGTWLTDTLIESLCILHERGVAHSVEVWRGDTLIGGLYGSVFGKCFYGESMFSTQSNGSKIALIVMSQNLARQGYELIDCQFRTDHLASMGGEYITREVFLAHVFANTQIQHTRESWSADFQGYKPT